MLAHRFLRKEIVKVFFAINCIVRLCVYNFSNEYMPKQRPERLEMLLMYISFTRDRYLLVKT